MTNGSSQPVSVDDLVLVSVDDHVIEPPTMFDAHLSAADKARAPKFTRDAEGRESWTYDGQKVQNIGLNAVVGRPPEEFGCEPTSLAEMRRGAWDSKARVEDMDVNGIVGSLCFPTFVGFEGSLFARSPDKANALTMLRAYNDWHIDEWCGSHPGRFIPCAIVPLWDPEEIGREVRRVAAKGCRAITFSDNPTAHGLPSIHSNHWEPLWKACEDEQVVICNHIGSGNSPPHPSLESPIDAWIIGMPISISISAADWLHLRAFQRYPNLKVALSEGGIGWIPYFLERADFTFQQHRAWTNADFGGKLPSEVFRDHFYTCFIDDKFGIANRDAVGVDTIMYECDYPHSDSVWPNSPEYLAQSLGGIPRDEIDKMTHGNAMRAFHYNPFDVLGREACTVSALRATAKHIDTVPRSLSGARPVDIGVRRPVTSGDVSKLFVDAA